MVQVRYNGRMGNNLFQWTLGRIISHVHDLYIPMYQGENHFEFTSTIGNGKDNLVGGPFKLLQGNKINFDQMVEERKRYVLDGYFQRAEYFVPFQHRIKEWLHLPESQFKPNDKDILLHIRRSDFGYENNGGCLTLNYYKKILDEGDFETVYVTGGRAHFGELEDVDNEVMKFFQSYEAIFIDDSSIETFKKIKQFKNVVQSMSTYCWWACFLSDNAERIYTPITRGGNWDPNVDNGIDLRINDPKYIYIQDVETEITGRRK